MRENKDACQRLCDSLSVANLSYFEVVNVEEIPFTERQTSMVLVGNVPVPVNRNRTIKGSLLTFSNGQQISVPYYNVPIGTNLVQMPIYVPKRGFFQRNYRPKFKKYGHALVADGKTYPLNL
jgi:hypothetical protein